MTDPGKWEDSKNYWMSGKSLNRLAAAVRERTVIAGPGIRIREIPQGIVVSAEGASAGGCPFTGAMVGEAFAFSVPGTLNAIIPDNLFDGGDLVALAFTPPGYIILSATTEDNNVQSCTLDTSATPPDPILTGEGVAPGAFDIPLFYVNAGGDVFRLIGCGSLWASAVEVFRTSNPTPDACGDPYIRHYTWSIATV